MNTIPRQLVGQLNVVGDCQCYGLALAGHMPIYIDLVGAATSVEAAWATLAQGNPTSIMQIGTHHMIRMQPNAASMVQRFQRRIPELHIDHLIIVHTWVVRPIYKERSTTAILKASPVQARAKLAQHITSLVKIAVFPEWHEYLETQGTAAKLIRDCACYGGVQAVLVDLDRDPWMRLICDGLEAGDIRLPQNR